MPETILDVLRAHSFNRPFTFLFYTHSDPSEVSVPCSVPQLKKLLEVKYPLFKSQQEVQKYCKHIDNLDEKFLKRVKINLKQGDFTNLQHITNLPTSCSAKSSPRITKSSKNQKSKALKGRMAGKKIQPSQKDSSNPKKGRKRLTTLLQQNITSLKKPAPLFEEVLERSDSSGDLMLSMSKFVDKLAIKYGALEEDNFSCLSSLNGATKVKKRKLHSLSYIDSIADPEE